MFPFHFRLVGYTGQSLLSQPDEISEFTPNNTKYSRNGMWHNSFISCKSASAFVCDLVDIVFPDATGNWTVSFSNHTATREEESHGLVEK